MRAISAARSARFRARKRLNGSVAATVGPMLVDLHSPLAWSRGTENMVILSGHYGGDVVFSGHGAGGHPTAVAVVSDLLALAHGSRRVEIPSAHASVGAEFEVPHYIRFLVNDRPGIVAEITGALARERINIRAIVQKAGYPADALPFVVTVEPCKSSALQRALESMRAWTACWSRRWICRCLNRVRDQRTEISGGRS